MGPSFSSKQSSHQTKPNNKKPTSTGFKQQRICTPLAPTRNKTSTKQLAPTDPILGPENLLKHLAKRWIKRSEDPYTVPCCHHVPKEKQKTNKKNTNKTKTNNTQRTTTAPVKVDPARTVGRNDLCIIKWIVMARKRKQQIKKKTNKTCVKLRFYKVRQKPFTQNDWRFSNAACNPFARCDGRTSKT